MSSISEKKDFMKKVNIIIDTREQKKACMKANKDLNFKCDFPMIKTEILKDYPDATWTTISKCAGILEIQKEK